MYQAIVGSAAQVASGAATHTAIQAAHDSISAGQSILVLAGIYIEAAVTITKQCTIEGQGNQSVLNGNLITTSTATHCKFGKIRVTGNVTVNASSNYNDLSVFWCANTSVVTDSGTSNYILAIQD
jgi:hypothetical protein